MLNFIVFLFLGYGLGSVSPGYFWGRVIKGIDIRNFGNGNTGASNTYRVVGPVYGIITAVFDLLKSPLAYYLSLSKINSDLAVLIGLAVVVGHIFPFYLNFKGGRGVASLGGLVMAMITQTQSWFTLAVAVGATFYMILVSDKVSRMWSWRKSMKLSALFLVFGFVVISEKLFLNLTGVLLVGALLFDGLRFYSTKVNLWYLGRKSLAKPKELKRLSGYTLFLFSAFLIFKFFSPEIALVSLTFFILSDLAGPIGGRLFLHKEITHGKTWGGAILMFSVCVVAGLFVKSLSALSIGWEIILAGALIATILDQLSFLLDDNILVPLGMATILTVLTYL